MYTIQALIAEAKTRLSGVSETAILDAEILLSALLQKNRSYLFTWPEKTVSEAVEQRYMELLVRRQQGEPVAYLLGHWSFWDLDLKVTPDTLVPRPETELLVEQALELIPADSSWNIADLGTGSGAIALAIASERPRVNIVATDISAAALEIAQQNAVQLSINNVDFVSSDWFAALNDKRFDLIVSNPPYIAEQDPHLSALKYEPHGALCSGAEGLDDICILVNEAPNHLVPGGTLMFEHGYDQGAASRERLSTTGFNAIHTLRDYAGIERVTVGRWPD